MPIDFEVKDKIATIVINRPETKNALNVAAFYELREAVAELEADATVRSIVVIGKGGNFSSGRDFRDKTPLPPDFEEQRTAAFNALEYCTKPTIAAVQGTCSAAGMMLACMCDLIVAADDARFLQVLQDVQAGRLTCRAVAEAHGLPFAPAAA